MSNKQCCARVKYGRCNKQSTLIPIDQEQKISSIWCDEHTKECSPGHIEYKAVCSEINEPNSINIKTCDKNKLDSKLSTEDIEKEFKIRKQNFDNCINARKRHTMDCVVKECQNEQHVKFENDLEKYSRDCTDEIKKLKIKSILPFDLYEDDELTPRSKLLRKKPLN